MKKKLVLLGLGLALIATSAFSLKEWRASIFDQIKAETIKGLKEAFHSDISIGQATGPLIGQVIFEDVVIPGVATAKKISVNYNLIKLAFYKGDIVPAISTITVAEAEIQITRNSRGLNVTSLAPSGPAEGDAAPAFRALIRLENCRVNYRDLVGFRQQPAKFEQTISNLRGTISFRRKDRIAFSLAGQIYEGVKPTGLKLAGNTNYVTGKFALNITANKVKLAHWGNYTVPLEPLNFTGGEADLALKIASPTTPGWPVSLVGNFDFINGQAKLAGYDFDQANGNLAMADDSLAFNDFSVRANQVPLLANGRYHNFLRHIFDLKLRSQNADLKKIVALFPPTAQLDLTGRANAQITATGPLADLKAAGWLSIDQGKFFGQPIAGRADLTYGKQQLKIALPDFSLYRGRLKADCLIDFQAVVPSLRLTAVLKELDLGALVQDAPGVVGKASGDLSLSGPITRLNGELSAKLSQAEILGQPMTNVFASLAVNDGDTYLETVSLRSETASFQASGSIKKDLSFDFKTQAQGIKLSGQGLLGPMAATIDSFQGRVNWQLDEQFLAAPLKNLTASGNAKLSHGRIGEQVFDLAQGQIDLGQGLIKINQVIFSHNQSVLEASGQTGLGYPTQLKVQGNKVELNDFKLVNYVLPKEAKNPSGTANLSLAITGLMSEEVNFDQLLDLKASGQINLVQSQLANIRIKQAKLELLWQNRQLSLPRCSLQTERSEVNLELHQLPQDQISAQLSGVIDFSEFRSLTSKFGQLSGRLGLNFKAQGPRNKPSLAAGFWLENFRFNSLSFDKVAGAATLDQDVLSLTQPLRLVSGTSQYQVTGQADLSAIAQGQPENIALDLRIKADPAELSATIDLAGKIQGEFARKAFQPTASGRTSLNLGTFALPTVRQYFDRGKIILYSSGQKQPAFLKTWDKLRQQLKAFIAQEPIANLGGQLKGTLSLKGPVKALSGGFQGEVKQGYYQNFTFDSLKARAALAKSQVKLDKFELTKKRGKLNVQGTINFNSTLDLNVTAQNLSLDALKIIFDKDFQGNFNMNASLSGPLTNLNINSAVAASYVTIAGLKFDRLSLQLSKRDDLIKLHDLSLIDNGKLSKVFGSLELSANGQVDLEASLQDNGLGLFNLVTNDVAWRRGQAQADLKIGGTMEQLDINGTVEVDSAAVYVRVIDAEIKQISAEASINQSQLKLPQATGFWQGQSSKNYANPLGLAGSIDLSHLLAKQRRVELDLAFSPTWLLVNLPNLFSGTVKIDQAKLAGPLYFDLSQGPTLTGQAQVDNAVITLVRGKGQKDKVFPLNFDLLLNLNKNVYAVMGDVATLDLSNIFMDLEINSPELKVAGSLKYPSLLGKIYLKRGTVTIFNREFTLLNMEQQGKFYPLNAEEVNENTASFSGEEGRQGTEPDIAIVAKVDVENQETSNNQTVIKKVAILSRLKGVIGAAERERGLDITFDSFIEDKSQSPTVWVPAGYSAQDIKVMLLPDFIKSLAGVGQNQDNNEVDTNAVVADYISSRLQTVVFRGLERELEQTLGLESLTLEYNFGKDVRQAMGVQETRLLEGDKPDWRVGFVKGLFDRFYLELNYAQYGAEAENPMEETFNYQLTYKLSPIWSIIYYREPTSFQELTTGYQKVTLKAGFSFW